MLPDIVGPEFVSRDEVEFDCHVCGDFMWSRDSCTIL